MFQDNQLNRYAIRKYAVGVCSVLVASLLFLGGGRVSADQLDQTTSPSIKQVHELIPPVETERLVQDKAQDSEIKEVVAENEPLEVSEKPLAQEQGSQVIELSTTVMLEETVETDLVVQDSLIDKTVSRPETDNSPEKEDPKTNEETDVDKKLKSVEAKEVALSTLESDPISEKPAVTTDQSTEPHLSDEGVLRLQATEVEVASSFRSVGMTRTATVPGVIGDDYPAAWKATSFPNSVADDYSMHRRYCTSFVAHRLHSANGFTLPSGYGDATTWGDVARSAGYRVDNQPARGSVAWGIAGDSHSNLGHVAWVADVSGDNVTIEEYNYFNDGRYHTRTVHKSAFTAYIHFKDLGPATSPGGSSNTVHGFPSQGTYTFTQRAPIKNEPKLSAPTRGFYEVGERVNYDRVVESDHQVWLSYINYSGSRSYVAVKSLTPATPPAPSRPTTGTIQIQNKNSQTGDFDVVITNVYHAAGVREVQVPVWSDKGGQDDIVWYRAQHQGGSTYKVSVKTSQHKNDTGTYHIHLYYVQDNGKQHGAGATTTQVYRQSETPIATPAPSLPSQGTYRFTKTLPIKSQAKMSSATIDYYYAGESVNYDRVLTAEGRQWISYVSYGGARRYIPLT